MKQGTIYVGIDDSKRKLVIGTLAWISHKEREPSRFFSGKLFLINGLPEERRPT